MMNFRRFLCLIINFLLQLSLRSFRLFRELEFQIVPTDASFHVQDRGAITVFRSKLIHCYFSTYASYGQISTVVEASSPRSHRCSRRAFKLVTQPRQLYLSLFSTDGVNQKPFALRFRSNTQLFDVHGNSESDLANQRSQIRDRNHRPTDADADANIGGTTNFLGMDDILSVEDLNIMESRFEELKLVFNSVNAVELREIISSHPLLLTMPVDQLRSALAKLLAVVPFVDPSYILLQRSAGLDLILLCMTSSFSNRSNIEDRINEVGKVIGSHRNVSEFIRRVPFVLSPRYLSVLKECLHSLSISLDISADVSLDMVESWPALLSLNSVTSSVQRLNATLQHQGVALSRGGLRRLVSTLPKSLIYRTTAQKVAQLQDKYPRWDLRVILERYPRILGLGQNKVDQSYRDICAAFVDECSDVDRLINAAPNILGFNVSSLRWKLDMLQKELPSCHDMYILDRAPELLVKYPAVELVRSITHVRRMFVTSQAVGGDDEYVVTRQSRDREAEESCTTITANPNSNSNSNMAAGVGNSVGSDAGAGKRASGVYELARYKGQEKEQAPPEGLYRENKNDTTIQVERLPLGIPAFEAAGAGRDGGTRQEGDAVVHENSATEAIADAGSAVLGPWSAQEQGTALDMTRIVLGNLEMFLDKFSYFTSRVQLWIEAMDPVAAYIILNAVPGQLTRKPASIRGIIKYLYGKIATKQYVHQGVPVSLNSLVSGVGGFSAELFGEINAGLSHPSDNYVRLGHFISEAPKLLKMTPHDLLEREQQLYKIFYAAPASSSPTAAITTGGLEPTDLPLLASTGSLYEGIDDNKQKSVVLPLLSAPRLLYEPMHRIMFRKELLARALAAKGFLQWGNDNSSNFQNPFLLMTPISTLARIPFAHRRLLSCLTSEVTVRMPANATANATATLTLERCGQFVICNTKEFLCRLQEATNLSTIADVALDEESDDSAMTIDIDKDMLLDYGEYIGQLYARIESLRDEVAPGMNHDEQEETSESRGNKSLAAADGDSEDSKVGVTDEGVQSADVEARSVAMMIDTSDYLATLREQEGKLCASLNSLADGYVQSTLDSIERTALFDRLGEIFIGLLYVNK